MYEIIISPDTPVGRVQKCLNELEPKAMWSDYNARKRTLVVDSTNSNVSDIKGTLYAIIGVDNIDDIREI